ncbi:MAG: MmcQ/YjbR family DNA-binding protein [Cytophagaceae bacterium]|nr:MmcQ/YjbR family DNA-binding protein [Cytophagaceae bacterium]
MNIEQLRNYCLKKKGVEEGFPFDENTLVFKVMGKMFALTDVDEFDGVNLKCDPEEAVQLREKYDAVQPGYHMSKKHWNTIIMDGSVSDKLIYEWVDKSYDLVVSKLTKKEKALLDKMK